MVRDVPICVGRFPVHRSRQLVFAVCHQDIQECKSPLCFLLNCEFNAGGHLVEVCWKDCRFCSPWRHMMKVSSTYLSQRLGWSGDECMACSSRSSMKRLAMIADRSPWGYRQFVWSVCIHIGKTSHRAKALIELPNYYKIHTNAIVIYILYIITLRLKDDKHKRTYHHLQSEYRVLQSLAYNIGTHLCIQTSACSFQWWISKFMKSPRHTRWKCVTF